MASFGTKQTQPKRGFLKSFLGGLTSGASSATGVSTNDLNKLADTATGAVTGSLGSLNAPTAQQVVQGVGGAITGASGSTLQTPTIPSTNPDMAGSLGTPQGTIAVSNQQRLAQEADLQGLTGVERQQYIEQGSGIASTPKPQSEIYPTATNIPSSSTPTNTPATSAASVASTPTPAVSTPTAETGAVSPWVQLQKEYTALFEPSEEEVQLEDQLNQLEEAARLGISGQERQGRGIPLGLIRGKQEQIAEQANIQMQTLEQRLANLQSQRIAKQQALASQLESAAPFEFGGSLVSLNPLTGELDTIATPPPAAAEPITLSPGETLIDPNTGQVLYQAGFKPETMPSSIQEYLFAAQQGYTGSFQDWQASGGGGTDFKAGELKAAGFLNRAQSAAETLANIPDIKALWAQQALPPLLQSENYKLFRQAGEDFIKAVLRQESGAAIPEEEMESYFQTYFPQPFDTDAVIAQKEASRNQMLESLKIEANNALQQAGQNNDPLGLGFSQVGADTQLGARFTQNAQQVFPTGSAGGQCGRFVNNLTGIGMGDSFENKMSFTDPNITVPAPGDVFVMPYSWTGHTGIVSQAVPRSDGTYDIYVVDSNWGLDERVQHHVINSSKIAGYARPGLKSQYANQLFV